MWKPEGSLTWREAFSGFHHITEQVINRLYGTSHNVDGKIIFTHTTEYYLVKAGVSQNYEEASLAISLMATFVMANFLDEFPPLVTDIKGNALELEWVFFTHKDQLELCYFDWPLKESAQFMPFFRYFDTNGFGSSDLYQRFAFINYETGMLRTTNGASNYLRFQLGFDEAGVKDVLHVAEEVKWSLVYWPAPFDNERLREFLAILEVNDDFTRVLDDLLGVRKTAGQDGNQAGSNPKRGRPANKTPDALSALLACFPDGIDGQSRKEVWKSVEAHTGKTFSERTVARAIQAFRAGGQIPH